MLGHYDTVYARGAIKKMPFVEKCGRAYGPGIFDMKGGIVQALFALRVLQQSKTALRKRIVFLWTSDEEIGSVSSRKLIETEARRSDAVFVMEPALGPLGLVKTARKAAGHAELIVHGRASHAGLAPEEGVNAIHELAQQLTRIQEWEELREGVSVNAGIIEGGTRINVIPARARAILDLRALHAVQVERIERRLRELRPTLSGARLEVRGGFDRPPLERKMSASLFAQAQDIAAQMGVELGECTAGGCSDGNFTAALGIPTLDGLGAVGDGAHSAQEHIIVKAMPQRAALLAALLCSV
ncbi:MAG: M20 family metallopeptidase [Candidatus Acidiferrum sp.]